MPWPFAIPGSLPSLAVLALVAALLFGNRLPGLIRSLFRGVVEFRRGLGLVDDDPADAGRKRLKK